MDLGIFAADSHLQPRVWKQRPIEGDSFFAFRQLVDCALGESLPLILAGDIVNAFLNEPQTAVFFNQQLKRLAKADVPVHFILGQHDGRGLWPKLDERTNHVHRKKFRLGKINCYGLDFQPADQLKAELAAIPDDVTLLVAHQVWEDFMGINTLPQGAFADLPKQIEILVTGDYHKWVLSKTKYRNSAGRALTVLSPGATHQTPAIDSPCDCYCAVFQSDCTFRKIPFRTRKFEEFAITFPQELDKFLAAVPANLEAAAKHATTNELPPELHVPLWRIVYNHKLSDLPQRVAKIVRNGQDAHLFWKEIPPAEEESQIQTKVQTAPKGETLTLHSCLAQAVSPKKEPAVFTLCQRLLDAKDPAAELVAWKKERLNDGNSDTEPEGD